MLRKTLGILLVMVFVLAPLVALGQMLPEGKWWRNPRVIKQLSLTEEQVSTMESVFIEHSRKLMKLRSAVQQEQFELGVLIDREGVNDDAVMKQVAKLDAQKAAVSAEYWRMVLDTRDAIGHENFQKLKESAEKKVKQKIRRYIGQEGQRKGKKPGGHQK